MIGGRRRASTGANDPGSTGGRQSGQTIVEFAIASTVLFLMIFGTLDFGRAVFVNVQLHNAVRDAAREMKVLEGGAISQSAIQTRVRMARNPETDAQSARPGLGAATATYSCSGSCESGDSLTINATVPFSAITQGFLGIPALTLSASATVRIE